MREFLDRLCIYSFGPMVDKDLNDEEFSRFDIALGVVFLLTSLITVAIAVGHLVPRRIPMDRDAWHRLTIWGSASLLILAVSRFRLLCIAAALAYVGVRLIRSVPVVAAYRVEIFLWGLGCLLAAGLVFKWALNREREQHM